MSSTCGCPRLAGVGWLPVKLGSQLVTETLQFEGEFGLLIQYFLPNILRRRDLLKKHRPGDRTLEGVDLTVRHHGGAHAATDHRGSMLTGSATLNRGRRLS